jgi:hypothetical protein
VVGTHTDRVARHILPTAGCAAPYDAGPAGYGCRPPSPPGDQTQAAAQCNALPDHAPQHRCAVQCHWLACCLMVDQQNTFGPKCPLNPSRQRWLTLPCGGVEIMSASGRPSRLRTFKSHCNSLRHGFRELRHFFPFRSGGYLTAAIEVRWLYNDILRLRVAIGTQ